MFKSSFVLSSLDLILFLLTFTVNIPIAWLFYVTSFACSYMWANAYDILRLLLSDRCSCICHLKCPSSMAFILSDVYLISIAHTLSFVSGTTKSYVTFIPAIVYMSPLEYILSIGSISYMSIRPDMSSRNQSFYIPSIDNDHPPHGSLHNFAVAGAKPRYLLPSAAKLCKHRTLALRAQQTSPMRPS